MTIFSKNSIVDILLGSKYASTAFFTEDKPSLLICTFQFVLQRIEKLKNFLPSKEKIAANLKLYLEVAYMRFILCHRKCFHRFSKWNSLQVLFHYSHFDKWDFISGDTYSEMKSSERKHLCMQIFHKSKGSWSKDQNKDSEN